MSVKISKKMFKELLLTRKYDGVNWFYTVQDNNVVRTHKRIANKVEQCGSINNLYIKLYKPTFEIPLEIISGCPLQGFHANYVGYDNMNEESPIIVNVNMFGRDTPVNLTQNDIEILS